MSRKLSVGTVVFVVLLAIVLTFSITYSSLYSSFKRKANESQLVQEQEDVFSKAEYVDALYGQYFVGELDKESLSDYLVRGYLAGTGDKYAYYMTKDEMKQVSNDTTGTMVGVGVHVVYDNTKAGIQVFACIPGSPAEEAGILPGDWIIGVDDESVAEIGYYSAVDKVQGEVGTDVKLTVLRGNETIYFNMTRRQIDNVSVTYRKYSDNVGIIRLYLFSENTGERVKEAVEALQAEGVTKLIFDVRSNSGGELNGIVNTLDYLLPEGPILHIQDKNGKTMKEYSSDAACVALPMVVLVNGNTASAAELFSIGLQDYKAATIVGTQTYGKGTVCSLISLPDGSGLSMSTQYYTPPYSDNIEGKGVTPDVVVALDESVSIYTIADADDTQLQAALQELGEAA